MTKLANLKVQLSLDDTGKLQLTIVGDLDLRDTAVMALPNNLGVGGGLYLNDTVTTGLAERLERRRQSLPRPHGHHEDSARGQGWQQSLRAENLRTGKISLNANRAPRAQPAGCFCF
jgi:hypothetical protein